MIGNHGHSVSVDTTALVWDVGFTAGRETLTAERKAELWAALADEDAEKGYRTLQELATDPAGFTALAAEKLKPSPAAPAAADLAPVLRDLGDPAFAVRQAASAKLLAFGEAVVPAVRDRLRAEPSAEARERLTSILERFNESPTGGDGLRRVRAVELLEHLGTPDARRVLDALAAGGPPRQTADATAAAKRLLRRP